MLASAKGHVLVVSKLIEHGANLNAGRGRVCFTSLLRCCWGRCDHDDHDNDDDGGDDDGDDAGGGNDDGDDEYSLTNDL